MKLGIISDIHGNLEALETVLKKLERLNVDEVICLGDIVGYGANPNECCELVREHCSVVVLGNHDEWALHPPDRGVVGANVWQSILWTANALDESHRQYFASLPLIRHRGNLIFVHAAPVEPQRWDYITNQTSAMKYFPYVAEKICFVGHSHLPGIYYIDDLQHNVTETSDFMQVNAAGKGAIINIGSVGQPRDGNATSSFCVYDSDVIPPAKIIRLGYDVKVAGEKIINVGLPRFFAVRLEKGF